MELITTVGAAAVLVIVGVLGILALGMAGRRMAGARRAPLPADPAARRELAALVLRFVEQAYRELNGEERVDRAVAWLVERVREKGADVDEKEIQGLIEAAAAAAGEAFRDAVCQADGDTVKPRLVRR